MVACKNLLQSIATAKEAWRLNIFNIHSNINRYCGYDRHYLDVLFQFRTSVIKNDFKNNQNHLDPFESWVALKNTV